MSGDLTGRTAIVTGGGRGLGRAIALGLAEAGANVIVTAARGRHEIEAVAEEARGMRAGVVRALQADVTSDEDAQRVVGEAIREWGAIHILVNNAGRGMRFVSEQFLTTPTKFWETDPSVWRMIIDTNVNGPFLMARAAVPQMLKQRWGRIVNLSMNYETMRRAGFSPYGPSKAALESATLIWAQDLAGTGVTVNSLLPGGVTETGMVPESARAELRARMLRPEIVMPPLLWLVSSAADDTTGERFNASLWDSSLAPRLAAEKARAHASAPIVGRR